MILRRIARFGKRQAIQMQRSLLGTEISLRRYYEQSAQVSEVQLKAKSRINEKEGFGLHRILA